MQTAATKKLTNNHYLHHLGTLPPVRTRAATRPA